MIVDTSFLIETVTALRSDHAAHPSPELLARIATATGWIAPDLIAYEVTNIVHRKRRAALPGPLGLRHQIRDGLLDPIELHASTPAALRLAAEICERTGCTAYDAMFLATASLMAQALLTADSGMATHAAALKIPVYLMPRDLPQLERDFAPAPKDT